MPRLLVVTQTHNRWGGIETWMSELMPHLESRGWQIDYGLALGRDHNRPEAFVEGHPYMRRTHILDARAGTRAVRMRALRSLVRRVQPDIVMPNAIGDALPAVIAERAAGSPVRFVAAVHSLHSGILADASMQSAHIDMFACVSGLLHRWAAELPEFGPARTRWIRNGVPLAAVERAPREAGVLRVGYVGRLEREIKRALDIAPILAAACAGGGRFALTIAGDGSARAAVEAQLRELTALQPARALGYHPREALYRDVYPKLDALLLTSATEGSPLAVLEAMHNGVVPVVSEFFGFASEGLLRAGVNCLTFPVGDVARAARALRRLQEDRELLERLSAAARESVRSQYSEPAMLEGWARALDDCLALPPRDAGTAQPDPLAHEGRLDRWGIPPQWVDWLRARAPRAPLPDGFDEWPGSIDAAPAHRAAIEARLAAIEDQARRELERQSHPPEFTEA